LFQDVFAVVGVVTAVTAVTAFTGVGGKTTRFLFITHKALHYFRLVVLVYLDDLTCLY
jgi:hypothetical protein